MDESYKNRINKNNEYYDLYFGKVKERTENREYQYLLNRFLKMLPSNTCIIDIGCGSGEHLSYFRQKSYQAYGIEPSKKMRSYCKNRGLNVLEGSSENILDTIRPIEQKIGGIWCAASMLHLPIELFGNTLLNLQRMLSDQGVIFFSLRLGNGSFLDKYDDIHQKAERFIQLYEEQYLENVLRQVGFNSKLKLIEESYWGRKVDWISYLLVKS